MQVSQLLAAALNEDLRHELRQRLQAKDDAALARMGLLDLVPPTDAPAAAAAFDSALLRLEVRHLRQQLHRRNSALLGNAGSEQLGPGVHINSSEADSSEVPPWLLTLMRRHHPALSDLQHACHMTGPAAGQLPAPLLQCMQEISHQVGRRGMQGWWGVMERGLGFLASMYPMLPL